MRMYHAKIGIFVRLIPGARAQSTATINSTAAVTEAISAKVIPISQKSAERPGVWACVVSGTYMNHPLSGAASNRKDDSTMMPPKR